MTGFFNIKNKERGEGIPPDHRGEMLLTKWLHAWTYLHGTCIHNFWKDFQTRPALDTLRTIPMRRV